MTTENEAVGAEALEQVQVGEGTASQPQENPETELADPAGGAEESGNQDPEKPKVKGGFQRKIEKQDAELAQVNKRNLELTVQLQRQNQELEDLRRKSQPATPTERPKRPSMQDFSSVEDYDKALDRFEQDMEAWSVSEGQKQARRQAEEQAAAIEATRVQARIQAQASAARAKYPDFNEVVQPILPIADANEVLTEFAKESDIGAEIIYHLGKNPALLLQLQNMSPVKAVQELSKLEQRLTAPAPAKTITKAPEPIKPVGARETVTKTMADLAASEDASAYIARANKMARPT